MKKTFSLLLSIVLLFSLIGCRPADNLNAPVQPQLQATEPTQAVTQEVTEAPTEVTTEPAQEQTQPQEEDNHFRETEPEEPRQTQPPQDQEIVDPRPHPADEAEQEREQLEQESGSRPTEAPQTPTEGPSEPTAQAPTEAPTEPDYPIDPNGWYTSRDDVALYIFTFGHLPGNYISKDAGDSQYGDYKNIPTSMNIGGDRFYNREGLLPGGYTYYECDIGTSGGRNRGAQRLVYTTSGIVYYTNDHYESFTRLY